MVQPRRGSDIAPGLRWMPDIDPALREGALLLLGASPVGTAAVVQDDDGRIVAADPRAEQLLGLSWEQLVGLSSMDPRWQAVSEDGVPLPGDQHPAMRALASGRSVTAALMGVMVPPGGTTRWLEVTAHPLPAPAGPEARGVGPEGGLCGVLALFADVSASARGRQAFGALVQAYRLMAENASDIVFRAEVDGTCRWISPSVEMLTGWRPIELLGQSMLDLVHPDDVPTVVEQRAALLDDRYIGRYQVRMRTRTGEYRWMSAVARRARFDDPSGPSAIVSLRDVDERVRDTARLAASERHYRMLADNSTDVIAHLRDGRLVWVTPSVLGAVGRDPQDLIGQRAVDLIHSGDTAAVDRAREELASGRTVRFTMRIAAADGSVPWFDVVGRPFADEHGQADGVVLRLRDVSKEVAATRRLEHLAGHDDLTGLVNRQALAERMRSIVQAAENGVQRFAVAFCDVDYFKAVNDTYGHEAGDELLKQIASRVTACVRSTDLVARLGGDEMVVILNGVRDLDEARAVMEKIRAAVATPFSLARTGVLTSLSIGLCLAQPGEDFEAGLRRADNAVYRAKESGRNRIETA